MASLNSGKPPPIPTTFLGRANYHFWKQFNNENLFRTQLVVSFATFCIALTKLKPEESALLSLVTLAAFPIVKALKTTDNSLGITERKIDSNAAQLNARDENLISNVEELQDIFECALNNTVYIAAYLFDCSCTELRLYDLENLKKMLQKNEKTQKSKCGYCFVEDEGNFKILKHEFLNELIELIKQKKAEEVKAKLLQIKVYSGKMDHKKKIDETGDKFPIINEKSEIYLAPKVDGIYYLPQGFKIDPTLLNLMNYIDAGKEPFGNNNN